MDESIYRKKSMDRITSPEELGDYLHVTNPSVWVILAAIILLLIGMLVWSSFASIDSFAVGTAQVENGSMRIYFDDALIASNVQSGMTVAVGETVSTISSVGTTVEGIRFASASTDLADGSYSARVLLRRTQVISLLFN